MSDVHGLSGAYAVDALDDLERARFERHLTECPECRAEVESLTEAASLLSDTTSFEPPASLRESVLASIETVRPLPPVVADLTARADRRRRRFQGLVAAAAAVTVLGAGAAVWQPWQESQPSVVGAVSATDEVLNAPDAERFEMKVGKQTVSVVRSAELNKAVLEAPELPPAPNGHAYAVWLQHDDAMVLAGVVNADDDTSAILLSGDARTADGAGITVEAAGERVSTPSPTLVGSVGFEQA
ncbi:anti-sigma factor [Nocardioides nanhaiensis]|uniref:Regulator of SigK n=1 Tax=Nocardioides nanhaiensis TaxID=1476871 RepID=A0ABP8VPL6_9ACTN